jgi:hypothetical protein
MTPATTTSEAIWVITPTISRSLWAGRAAGGCDVVRNEWDVSKPTPLT